MQAPETRRGQRRRGRALSSQSSMKGIFLSAVTTDPPGAPARRKTGADRPARPAVREFRPQVILGYDENGGYPHPDHVKCHQVTIEAFEAAADPDRYPDCGEPWQPLKLYYFATFHRARFAALHEEMARRGLESPYAQRLDEWVDNPDKPGLEITTRVPCGDFFEIRDQALLAHATQIDPAEGFWFACPREVQQAAWPTEDFHLARSVVDTEKPESDLFAGVRETLRV